MLGTHRIDWHQRRPAATGGAGARLRSVGDGLRKDVWAFVRSIRERGVLSSLHIALSTLWCAFLDQLDEWTYRTNTSGGVPLASLEIPSENKAHAGPYSTPSQFRIMKKAFKAATELRGGLERLLHDAELARSGVRPGVSLILAGDLEGRERDPARRVGPVGPFVELVQEGAPQGAQCDVKRGQNPALANAPDKCPDVLAQPVTDRAQSRPGAAGRRRAPLMPVNAVGP